MVHIKKSLKKERKKNLVDDPNVENGIVVLGP